MVRSRLTAHVIHLRRREDRKERFLRWNAGHAVEWHWHDAVEAAAVDRQDGELLSSPDLAVDDAVIATAMSHRRQWRQCVADDAPRLIFEDDACARHGFEPLLSRGLAGLSAADLIFFGCNTDAELMLELPDRLFSYVVFGNAAHASPGYFDAFAKTAPPCSPPILYQAYLTWGLLAYAVSPAGAAKLLRECFPLRPVTVDLFQHGRKVESMAIDAMLNAAMQRGAVRALTCFPPLVIGPNADSDLDARKG
ncbi:glycosyltransferase family 25 protein [Magnetospirillum sulfuroxidans]|uniref:Glycosyltransferase family 25 protein n=1 Tax=Magnetospirillum sulfuroxidans TaxID=611300 RepID=A0ABS5ICL1_9PROT|nr:glycosyltransferase family 25 protein [Magnetospirillum sulfuroxidans]MBR9972159.1 glycosyltransferase family 25 protein [Magnetospirillum sulfuroxidans]